MLRLMLDGEPASLDGCPETLADLLACVDEHCARRGRIVTAVRLDGVEEPAFREPSVLSRHANSLTVVEIVSGTRGELVRQCLGEAGDALEALAAAAIDVAARLRAGDVRSGNVDLAAIADGITTVLTITGAASLGLGIDIATLESPRGTLAEVARRTSTALTDIISAQAASEWSTVADRLEHELGPELRHWGGVCRALDPEPDAHHPVSRLHFTDSVRA